MPFDKCIQPFQGSFKCSKSTMKIKPWISEKLKTVLNVEANESDYICSSCHVKISTIKTESASSSVERSENIEQIPLVDEDPDVIMSSPEVPHKSPASVPSSATPSSAKSVIDLNRQLIVEKLNEIFPLLQKSKIDFHKIMSKTYIMDKLNDFAETLKTILVPEYSTTSDLEHSVETKEKAKNFDSMINDFKEIFPRIKQTDKIKLLSVIPLSCQTAIQNFGVSKKFYYKCQNLRALHGPFREEIPKLYTKKISNETAKIIEEFYNHDENSRIMAGMKDFVSVKVNNVKVKIQKRILLSTISEAHQEFLKQNLGVKIGFSTFARLRPKNVLLSSSTSAHNICVCVVHQNVKIMMETSNIPSITEQELKDWRSCINKVLCPQPTSLCYLLTCKQCPRWDNIKQILYDKFRVEGFSEIDNIKFV